MLKTLLCPIGNWYSIVRCLQYAPHDYLADLYAKPHNKNGLVTELLQDITSCARGDKNMFAHAVEVLRHIIKEKEGQERKEGREDTRKNKEGVDNCVSTYPLS
jgi:hypothetical protein